MLKGFLGIIGIILGVLFIGWLCTTSLVQMFAGLYTNTTGYFRRKFVGKKETPASSSTSSPGPQAGEASQASSMKFTRGFCEICGEEFIADPGNPEPCLRQVQLKVDENGKPVSRVICQECLRKIQDLFNGKPAA